MRFVGWSWQWNEWSRMLQQQICPSKEGWCHPTKRTVLYFIWEGSQTLAQSFWKVDQFCALDTQGMCTLWIGLALAWPRSMMGLGISVLVVPWPRKLCLLLVLNVQSTCGELRPGDCVLALNRLLVYRFCTFYSSFEQISCLVKSISEPSSADMGQAGTITIPSCTINQ